MVVSTVGVEASEVVIIEGLQEVGEEEGGLEGKLTQQSLHF